MGGRNVVSDEEDEFEEDGDREEQEVEGEDLDERNDDDDEEEEEGQDEYEKDGFIVDEVEEEEEQEEERDSDEELRAKRKKKKRRDTEENYELDEDDYELLQEANITGFHRPKPGSKKFKRLKKAGRDNESEHRTGFSDDEDIVETGKSGRTAEEKLKRSLFGDDEGVPQDIAEEEEPLEEDDVDVADDMSDFIVDEEEDENGIVTRRRKTKKKTMRHAPGISSTALQEAHDIFGDVDELLLLRKQGQKQAADFDESGDRRSRRLEDEFEPSIVMEKYLSEKDQAIRAKDAPERLQLFEETVGRIPEDDESIHAEASWIYDQLTGHSAMFPELENRIVREDIANVLEMMHKKKYEIPFIAMYRKEQCRSLLSGPGEDAATTEDGDPKPTMKWHKVLWAVHHLDKRWLLLQRRKNLLIMNYKKRAAEEAGDPSKVLLIELLIERLREKADTEKLVDDIDLKYNLHFPPGETDVEQGQYKRPKRKSLYSVCRKAGLGNAVSKFWMSAERLGKCLEMVQQAMEEEVSDLTEMPEEAASQYVCRGFEIPQDVLKGARHMAAVEISYEPLVRNHVRELYMSNAVVSTRPTTEGNSVIDYFHQLSGMKWLRSKPLSEFKDAQWLLIQKAEEDKLLEVTISYPNADVLFTEFRSCYCSLGVSIRANSWNEQRDMILKDVLHNLLFPAMEKEARTLLCSRAKNWLLMEYGKQFWNKVSVAPYQKKENDDQQQEADADVNNDVEGAPRVMACCWGPGKPATTFVMLEAGGDIVDTLITPYLNMRSKSLSGPPAEKKKQDEQRVQKFMANHQPHVVVVGAANLQCHYLKEEIYETIFKMVEDHPRELGSEDISVIYGDESLPRLYENSRVSVEQLHKQDGIVRRATALGRYLQNPLAMVATLCGPGKEILSLKINPMDNFLTPDEKYEMIEQIMVDATNQIGVDVNLAVSRPWLFAPLQFVSGLGPRKSSSLQRAVVGDGVIYIRKDIVKYLKVSDRSSLQRNVFINSAAFLRIRGSGQAAHGTHMFDLLDDTRIHPESYEVAVKMAKDVYAAYMDVDLDNIDEGAQEMAIENVRSDPKLLKALDIDEYCKSIELQVGPNKKDTLLDIKMELLHGFRDWRTPYTVQNPEEEFYMLTGENEDTLAEGRPIQATVRTVTDQKVYCQLESGLTAFINVEDLDLLDDGEGDITDKVMVGSTLACKVKGVLKNKPPYQVILTCKETDSKSMLWKIEQKRDAYYKEDDGSLQTARDKAKRDERARKSFKPRMIVHPRFQNLTADEAMEFLSDKEAGESVIRPSSRGPSFLTLTLKIYDGVYAHKDIAESGKDHKDITSLLRLGKKLEIGEDSFEDLDEVMDRYVDPLVANLKTMLSYRKFRHGSKAEVDDSLKSEKADNPSRIVYAFGVSHEHPGTFILSYIRTMNPHHEFVSIYPKGFKFRKRMFDSLDRLVGYFQRHVDDPLNDVPPNRSVAAMVPMKSPASGGFSGAGSVGSGGWGGGDGGWKDRGHSDRDRSSTPGSRTGRGDYRNGNNGDGHPSGAPRPYGRGRGRGRRGDEGGRGRGRHDSGSGFGSSWSQNSGSGGGGGGYGSWGGSKNLSPTRDDAAGNGGAWGSGGGSGGGGGWGSNDGGGGWGSNDGGADGSGNAAPDNGGWGAAEASGAGAKDGGGGEWGSASATTNNNTGKWAGDPDVPGGW